MVGREPGEADGYSVSCGAEGDVGDRLGTGSYGGADGCLGGVGGECNGCAQGGGEHLHLRSELRTGVVGDERGDRDADEGVKDIPEEVYGGDLVGEEFDGEEDGAGDDDPGVAEGVEAWWELDDVGAGEESEGEDGGVDVNSGGEAGGNDQRGDVCWGEHLGELYAWGWG